LHVPQATARRHCGRRPRHAGAAGLFPGRARQGTGRRQAERVHRRPPQNPQPAIRIINVNGKEEVWDAVEKFRRQYLVGPLAHLPVDVFTLAELEFKLDIIPFDDLYEKYEVDAALMQDFSGIYVDAEAYI